ncbi:MAG: hypothetical protein VB814_01805, partial [Pirellulaceae bacterium]
VGDIDMDRFGDLYSFSVNWDETMRDRIDEHSKLMLRFASVYREFKDVRDFVDELQPILDRS